MTIKLFKTSFSHPLCPSPAFLSSLQQCIIVSRFLFQADATLQIKALIWTFCGHLNGWKALKCDCVFTATQGSLTTQDAKDRNSDLKPLAWDWHQLIYLFPFNHELILRIFGEILCPSDLFKRNTTWNVPTLPALLDQTWNNLRTLSIWQNTQKGNDLLSP